MNRERKHLFSSKEVRRKYQSLFLTATKWSLSFDHRKTRWRTQKKSLKATMKSHLNWNFPWRKTQIPHSNFNSSSEPSLLAQAQTSSLSPQESSEKTQSQPPPKLKWVTSRSRTSTSKPSLNGVQSKTSYRQHSDSKKKLRNYWITPVTSWNS